VRGALVATRRWAAKLEEDALAFDPSVRTMFVAALALGALVLAFYQREGLTLIDGDSAGHLYIARRTVESLTPSFAQLGGTWLPLPHVLMIPLVWSDALWESGLAGGIVSTIAFAGAAAYVYASVRRISEHSLAGVLASALFATNANLLYMQTTAMTEPLTILIIVAATYHMLRWTESGSLVQLLVSALWVMAGTLVRYEMWSLVPAGTAIVAFTGLRRNGWRAAEGLAVAWATVASYGIVLWLIYSQVVFGDALNFMRGDGTGAAFAAEKSAQGLLPYHGHPLVAIQYYGWATIDNLGLPLAAAGLAGAIALLSRRTSWPIKLALLLPVTLFAFEALSLTIGQSAMGNPHTDPPQFVNSRYGLLMLPAAVLMAGQLVRLRTVGAVLLVAALAPQLVALPGVLNPRHTLERSATTDLRQLARTWTDDNFPFLRGGQQITLLDAALAGGVDPHEVDAGTWVRENDPGGRILISTVRNDAALLMMRSGLPVARFVTEGNKPYFANALRSTDQLSLIVYEPYSARDNVRSLFQDGPPDGFVLDFDNGDFQIYGRSSLGGGDRPTGVPAGALPMTPGTSIGFLRLPRGVPAAATYVGYALKCEHSLLELATSRWVFYADADCHELGITNHTRERELGGPVRVELDNANTFTIYSDRDRFDVPVRRAWSEPFIAPGQ
jgi:hypothetical protein